MNGKMTTLQSLQEETNQYLNTLVLDGEDDFYYQYLYFYAKEASLFSCVGYIIPLKGKITDNEHNCLLSIWNWNHPENRAV